MYRLLLIPRILHSACISTSFLDRWVDSEGKIFMSSHILIHMCMHFEEGTIDTPGCSLYLKHTYTHYTLKLNTVVA